MNATNLEKSSIAEVLSKLTDNNLVSNKKTSVAVDSVRVMTEESGDYISV